MGTAERVGGYAALTRPVLRSGLRVVRRDDARLQIGLDPPDRLVLPDLPGLLETLSSPPGRPDPSLTAVLDRLAAEGWLVEAGAEAERVRSRAAARPAISLVADAPAAEAVAGACRSAGLRLTGEPAAHTVHLVVSVGEPRRTSSDALVRDDRPHVFVALLPHAVRIGPFVEPGRTPCLRCLDAHLGERDPRRATVLHQLEQAGAPPADTWDRSLAQLGCAWAARDVVRRLDGDLPSLRAATVTVRDDLEVTRHEWLRHPHCGCAWG